MASGTQKQAHALISYYEVQFKNKFKRLPRVNRHADKWGFLDMLQGMSESHIRELLDFYFLTSNSKGHTLQWFFYNYDKLDEALEEKKRDAVERRKLREKSKKQTEQYREQYGNNRSETN